MLLQQKVRICISIYDCGSKPMVLFWGGCTAHFGGDWDVHWGYRLLTYGHMYVYIYIYIYNVCAWCKSGCCLGPLTRLPKSTRELVRTLESNLNCRSVWLLHTPVISTTVVKFRGGYFAQALTCAWQDCTFETAFYEKRLASA